MDEFISVECTNDDGNYICNKLIEYNLSQVPLEQKEDFININRKIVDKNGRTVAGLLGKMYCWNCLYIDILWVDEEYRKKGLGKQLLLEVEKVAKEKGCYLIHLDTFDFQAKDFYIKNGYEIFGVLEECPKEHRRYYLKKLL